MTFGEKLRRARREKGLTQAELANQAGLGLRTIIAYEKGETYPQKRSTYQTLANILGMQADELHNEETTASAPPLSRTQWENSKRRYEELLPDGPAWPGDSTYEAYCEKMAQLSKADAAHNYCNSTGKELPQITIRPALAKDFPTLLQICNDRCQFDATRAGVDKSRLPTFESQLETLTQSLVARNPDAVPRRLDRRRTVLPGGSQRPPRGLVRLAAPRAGRLSLRQQTKRRREGNGLHAAAPRHHVGSLCKPPFCRCFQTHASFLPSLLPAAGNRGSSG